VFAGTFSLNSNSNRIHGAALDGFVLSRAINDY